jgi:hypothetical protein
VNLYGFVENDALVKFDYLGLTFVRPPDPAPEVTVTCSQKYKCRPQADQCKCPEDDKVTKTSTKRYTSEKGARAAALVRAREDAKKKAIGATADACGDKCLSVLDGEAECDG